MRILPVMLLAACSVVTVASVLAVASAPCRAQGATTGGAAPDAQSAPTGSSGGGRKGGRGGGSQAEKKPATPRADDKAFRSAIDRLPDQKYDPWRNAR